MKNIIFLAILFNSLFSYSCTAAISEAELKKAKTTVKVETLVRVGVGTAGGAIGAGILVVVGSLITKKDVQKTEVIQAIASGCFCGFVTVMASIMAEAYDELQNKDSSEQKKEELKEDLKRRN